MEISNIIEVVKSCKKGDKEAWSLIIKHYSKMVFNITYNFFGDRDTAADLTQEIFLKLYKNINGFRIDNSFNAWVSTMTKNHCIDYWRQNKKFLSLDEICEYSSFDLNSPEDNAITDSEISYIRSSLKKIEPEMRIFLIFRDILLFSYQEIAEFFSLPEGTVKSRINRARNKLLELYNKGVNRNEM